MEIGREVHILVSVTNPRKLTGAQKALWNCLRQDLRTAVEPSADALEHVVLCKPAAQFVNRYDMAGHCSFPGSRLIGRVCHGAVLALHFHLPVEDVFAATDNVVFHPILIEVGNIGDAGFIRHAEFYQLHTAPDTDKPRFIRGYYRYAGSFSISAERDELCLAPVLIPPREEGQQVIKRKDAQFFKSFRALLTDAAHGGDRGAQRKTGIIQHNEVYRSCSAGQTVQASPTCRSLRCHC